jgi:hypothetical protein
MEVNVMAGEPHRLSDWFIDDVGNEVEVVTSEMQLRSDSEDVQPMELGAYVGIIRLGYKFRLHIIVRTSKYNVVMYEH